MVYKYKEMQLADRRLRRRLKQIPLTFTRSGVAYDYQGNSVPENTPRFTHLINGVIQQGCLIEEAHTNLLTANQSTCTDTLGNTTGFTEYGAVTLSSSTDYSMQGTKSLKVVTPGEVVAEGVYFTTTVSASTTYTFSAWVKAPLGAIMEVHGDCWNNLLYFTGTGDWQYIQGSKSSGGCTSLPIRIRNAGVAQANTFYVDMLQLTATAYPLSWTLGGTTSNAETLTAPSSVIDLATGTIELEMFANSNIKQNSLNNYLIDTADGSANNRIMVLDDSSNNLTVSTKASAAATAVSYADSNLTLNNWYKIGIPYNSTYLKLLLNGVSVGTPLTSVNLPITKQSVYFGSKYDGTTQANTLIRNITFNSPIKADSDMTNRSSQNINGVGFKVDKNTKIVSPLKTNLNAYRVKA